MHRNAIDSGSATLRIRTKTWIVPVKMTWLTTLVVGVLFAMRVDAAEPLAKPVAKADSSDANTAAIATAVKLLNEYGGDGRMLADAKQILSSEITKHPKNAAAHREMARYYIMSGRRVRLNFAAGSLEAAEKSLNTAIAINPNYAEAFILFGHLYRLMERPMEAKKALTRAEAIGTNDPWLQNNWADLMLDEGNSKAAVERYTKVLSNRSANAKAVGVASEGLIRNYVESGQLDKADRVYRSMITRDPQDAWTHGNYGHFLLCRMDKFEAAIRELETALGVKDYGAARSTLNAARYRKWAALYTSGNVVEAKVLRDQLVRYDDRPSVEVMSEACWTGAAVTAVLKANEKRMSAPQ